MRSTELPRYVVWEMTYACPLRCGHCSTNSGRRPSRQPPLSELHRLVDAIALLAPAQVLVSGGEPLVVPHIWEVLRHLKEVGLQILLFTSGWRIDEETAAQLAELTDSVHLSLDGPDPQINDAVRGRVGAFDTAINALFALDRASSNHNEFLFGIEHTVVRSNFTSLDRFCSEVASRFQRLGYIHFGAALPSGAGNREHLVETELLTEEELDRLRGPALAGALRELVPPETKLFLSDQMDILQVTGQQEETVYLEPDGALRALPAAQGIVGNVLDDSLVVLWERTRARRQHPEVLQELSWPKSLQDWATAVRRLDARFGADDQLAQIRRT